MLRAEERSLPGSQLAHTLPGAPPHHQLYVLLAASVGPALTPRSFS